MQAFTVGPHVGVQFHPEATPSLVARWSQTSDLPAPDGLRPDALRLAPAAAVNARALFDAWAAGAGLARQEAAVAAPA